MSEYKIGSVVFNPHTNAAVPHVPTGYQGRLVGCGDGDTRIPDVGGLMREIERLRSEIANHREVAIQWQRTLLAHQAEIALRDRCIEWMVTAFSVQKSEVPTELAGTIFGKAGSEVAK